MGTTDLAREAQRTNGANADRAELSPEVLDLFERLLAQVQVPAGADDFEEQAALVTKARQELRDAKGD